MDVPPVDGCTPSKLAGEVEKRPALDNAFQPGPLRSREPWRRTIIDDRQEPPCRSNGERPPRSSRTLSKPFDDVSVEQPASTDPIRSKIATSDQQTYPSVADPQTPSRIRDTQPIHETTVSKPQPIRVVRSFGEHDLGTPGEHVAPS